MRSIWNNGPSGEEWAKVCLFKRWEEERDPENNVLE